jgi:phosphohistidine phosphatase SixA
MTSLAFTACSFASPLKAEQPLWGTLARGGYVLLMPHASAVPADTSPTNLEVDQCRNLDLLTRRGRYQAQRLKDALRRHAITVGRVLTSHDCRCIETASAVFGQAEPWSIIDDTRNDDTPTVSNKRIALREALSRWQSNENLALVSHQTSIRAALDVKTQPAEVLVIEPLGDAGFRLVGRLRFD